MDKIDCKILGLLQQDATRSTTDIAAAVGLSSTPCWRRIQRLEERGVIRKRVALLSRRRLNLGVDVFVAVKSNYHTYEWLEAFSKTVSKFPEVVEFYRMSGEVDYMLRVVVADMNAYDTFYRQLISKVQLTDVSSSFAMEELKFTTALPLEVDLLS